MKENSFIYNYMFHYNIYNEQWNAIPREKITEYWNNVNCPDVIKHKDFNTLMKIIEKLNFVKDV